MGNVGTLDYGKEGMGSWASKFCGGLIRKIKDNILPLCVIGATAAFCGGLYESTGRVAPLGEFDFNNDGKKEKVVAFPIPGRDKCALRYIDSGYAEKNKVRFGNEVHYRINYFLSKPLNAPSVGSEYNVGMPSGDEMIIEDIDKDGKVDILMTPSRCGFKLFSNVLAK